MAGLDEKIKARNGVPVVDGVSAAVTIAESLVRLQLTTSKVRTYAAPRPKTIIGWPLNIRRPLRTPSITFAGHNHSPAIIRGAWHADSQNSGNWGVCLGDRKSTRLNSSH